MTEQTINSQQSLEQYKDFLDAQFEKHKFLRLTLKTGKQRTSLQNASLHLYCTQLAEAFNDAGLDMVTVLAEGTEIPWSEEKVKEDIWRKVQIELTGKKSTTKLNRDEVSQVYDVINRYISGTFGLFVAFPSKESLHDTNRHD